MLGLGHNQPSLGDGRGSEPRGRARTNAQVELPKLGTRQNRQLPVQGLQGVIGVGIGKVGQGQNPVPGCCLLPVDEVPSHLHAARGNYQ